MDWTVETTIEELGGPCGEVATSDGKTLYVALQKRGIGPRRGCGVQYGHGNASGRGRAH